jgi:hypothetical protein
MGGSKKKHQKEEKVIYKLEITKRARNSINLSYNWYEERRSELGSEFLLAVEASLNILKRDPFIYRIRYSDSIRAALLKRFPFLVYYKINGSSVIILAVMHFKQDSKPFLKKYSDD